MLIGKLIRTIGIVFVCAFVMSETSQAVVQKRSEAPAGRTNWITTEIAGRAHSDVQLRRLMGMFSAKEIDSEVLYRHLESMRQKKERK